MLQHYQTMLKDTLKGFSYIWSMKNLIFNKGLRVNSIKNINIYYPIFSIAKFSKNAHGPKMFKISHLIYKDKNLPLKNKIYYDSHSIKPKLLNPSLCYFQTVKHFSDKRNNINHLPLLKVKKRIQRKKRDIDEISEENVDGFQYGLHHKFQTYDPEFAIPDFEHHKQVKHEFPVIAYATADEYNLRGFKDSMKHQSRFLQTKITSQGDQSSSSKFIDPEDAIHFVAPNSSDTETSNLYVFRDGVVVFWNVFLRDREEILSFLKNYETQSYTKKIILDEVETLAYKYIDSSTRIKSSQNLILFNKNGKTDIEKFTFSNVLSQSVKLGIWESSLDIYVDSIEHVTEELSLSGRVILTQGEVLQKMGQLFSLRHDINLRSDLLDTPDFYWDHENLELLYNRAAKYLSIDKRTSVMNVRLSHCVELMELLKSHLNERHSSRLEWIIIILIMVEVFFEVLHYV